MHVDPIRYAHKLCFVYVLALLFLSVPNTSHAERERPNILFLSVDDMRDWAGFLDGYDGPVHTPNMDRLAARGINFTNAHCPSPVCNPSRTAIYSGRMPSTTGVYDNSQWLRPHRPDIKTLPSFLRSQGYKVVGAGKSYHHTIGNNPPDQWDEYFEFPWADIPWMRQNRRNFPHVPVAETPEEFPFSGVTMSGFEEDWGVLPISEPEYDDPKVADYGIQFLEQDHEKPFFLSVGTFHPHVPWYAPQAYYDLYDPTLVTLPPILESDLDDIPAEGQRLAAYRREGLHAAIAAKQFKNSIHYYLASISFADAQIGRLLDSLAHSTYAENTIVVLWSDHGYHLGEKDHLAKFTLWEESTRVPFIIATPDSKTAGQTCERPVNLVDLFPTLMSLTGLEFDQALDGRDLTPLLKDPTQPWPYPSIIEFGKGNAAARDERWRYILYHDGGEELYDHQIDPHEWTNLAADPVHSEVKQRLRSQLPETWAPPAPSKPAYEFDGTTYSWKHRQTGTVTKGK